MSRPSVTRSIGGYEVSTTKLKPTAALKLAPKVLRVLLPALKLAPVFGPLLRAGGALTPELVAGVLGRIDLDQLVAAGVELLGTLDDATLTMLYKELLADTSITVPDEAGRLHVVELNTPNMIDVAFGRLDNGINLLVETMVFVGEVNFRHSFFDLVARMGLKKAPKATDPA